MKKRKLTKEQIEKRKHFLKVTKNVVFYISLALNAIVLIALCVGGCSSSRANVCQTNDDHIALLDKPRIEKNDRITDFDIYNNSSTICYDLTTLNITTRDYISTGEYHYFSTTDNIILFGGDGIVWSDVNEIYVSFNVFQAGVDGNSIQISAIHRNSDNTSYRVAGRYWGYSNGAWQTQDLPNDSGYSTLNGFYIAFNYAKTNENQFGLIGLLENCFNTVDYHDYYNASWNIYEKFPYTRETSSSAPSHYNIVSDVIFAVNGNLYDEIELWYSGYGTKVYYEDNQSTGVLENKEIITHVTFRNSTTNQRIYVYSPVYRAIDDSGNIAQVYGKYKLNNVNYVNIRLFGLNLSSGVIDIFEYQSSSTIDYGGEGQFGDIFGLITTAFTGLAGLFTITILPGITIGMLLFLPLVALIVFALIRVIKK